MLEIPKHQRRRHELGAFGRLMEDEKQGRFTGKPKPKKRPGKNAKRKKIARDRVASAKNKSAKRVISGMSTPRHGDDAEAAFSRERAANAKSVDRLTISQSITKHTPVWVMSETGTCRFFAPAATTISTKGSTE